MPYREAPSEAPCHQCERPARDTCPCCTRYTCERHLLVDKKMCGTCDEAYYRYMHREDKGGVGVQAMAVMAIASVPAILTTTMLPLTIAAIFLGFPGVLWYRKARDHRKFLGMMRMRGALPDTGPQPTESEIALTKYEAKLADRRADRIQATFEASESTHKPDLADGRADE